MEGLSRRWVSSAVLHLWTGFAIVAAMLPGTPFRAIAQENISVPTLRIESREVVLDIVVTDKSGHVVNGLTDQDFTVLEDKVPQRIVYFQPPSMHELRSNVPPVRSAADLSRIGNSPITLLVMDELNTTFEDMAFSRWAMEKWLERQPEILKQPTVLLALSDGHFYVVHDYTQNRAELIETVRKHMPTYPFLMAKGGAAGTDAVRRMALSLGAMMQIAQSSSGVPGRKNVIWTGAGFPSLSLDDVSPADEGEITNAVAKTTATLLKARVTLNIIDPTAISVSTIDLTGPDYLDLNQLRTAFGPTATPPSGILSFDTFAPATGGIFSAGRNDIDREIARASENGSSYYTVEYSPSNRDDTQPKFRNIRVVMRDPNLTATTRTGYFPAPAVEIGPPKPPPTSQLAFDLTNAALSTLSYNGLAVEASRTDGGYDLKVQRSGLADQTLSAGGQQAEVTVMAVCLGSKKNVLSHTVSELKARLVLNISTDAVTFHLAMASVPRGTARIRLVVRDALNGHIGTVDLPAQ